jgi:demethylmenaquinone methyltransferase / 2-methoxy-6-polyprenyl-1,4-benzoquinol methylase
MANDGLEIIMKYHDSSESKSQYIHDLFNKIALRYDLMNRIMSFGLDGHWRSIVVKKSEIKSDSTGLDICCGTGMLSIALAKFSGIHGQITALDFSENMLVIAKQNALKSGTKDMISFIQADATHLPFPNSIFDYVTVAWGLRNVSHLNTTISEMVRVVRPGGKIVSIEMGQPVLPIFRELYWFLFRYIIPKIGNLITGNKQAYQYLHDSSAVFIGQQQLSDKFRKSGLIDVSITNLLAGAIAIVEGRKADSETYK